MINANRSILQMTSLLLVFSFITLIASAQTGTVTGMVKGANAMSLSGASITVQGSGRGTTTNAEGMFTLSLNPGKYTIVASYVGYGSANKVTIGANNLLDVYPEKTADVATTGGNQFIYSRRVTQIGYNGRYLFGRLELSL